MGKQFLAIAAAASFALTTSAQATIVLQDNFDGENGGATALNYTGFTNWISNGAGGVDLVAMPDFGLTCAGGSGSCVDLDGSAGPGRIETARSYAFNAGDRVLLTFDISGSQRGNDSDIWRAGFSFVNPTDILGFGYNVAGTDIFTPQLRLGTTRIFLVPTLTPDAPFANRNIYFTAAESGALNVFFGDRGSDGIGPILDNVVLDISAAVPEPASWAMLIAGFALVGGAMRWRTDPARLRQLNLQKRMTSGV
jgi:hypothetical protein